MVEKVNRKTINILNFWILQCTPQLLSKDWESMGLKSLVGDIHKKLTTVKIFTTSHELFVNSFSEKKCELIIFVK